MRIALLTTRSGPQAARFAALCNGLAERGHEVAAVCPPGVKAALAPGVRHLPWRAAGAWWNPLTLGSLALALTGFRPEIVHAHGDLAARLVTRLAGRVGHWPMVASLSDRASPRAFAEAFGMVLLSSPAALDRFQAQHPAVAAQVVFPAAAWAPAAEGAGQALRDRLCVPWGAPVALVRREPGAADDLPAAAGASGGGLAELLQLWEWVGEAELWVAGDGSAQARELEAQCRNLGRLIEGGYERGGSVNGIRFFTRHEEPAALLDACDFVVLPAGIPGQTGVLAQALLAGKPVVAAGNAWADEVLPPGYAVPADDTGALREALGVLVADVAMAKAGQAEAFAHAARAWTPEAMAAQLEAVYAALRAFA